MKTLLKFGACALLSSLTVALPAWAVSDADTAALERRIKALEEQLYSGAGKDAVIATSNGRSLTFRNDEFSFQVGGRLQLDAAAYNADQAGNEFGSGTRVRRLFLDVRGTAYENWNFRFQYDFARPGGSDSSARGIRDAWIQYTGFGPAIAIGNFKEPFGLEQLASNLNTTFIERALTNALIAPDRRLGVGISRQYSQWTYSVGVFGEPAEGDVGNEGDEAWGVTGRLTYAPVNVQGQVVHFGLSGRQRAQEDSTDLLRIRERPESNVTNVRLIDTGILADMTDLQYTGLEAAAVFGPFSLQSEWVGTQASRDNGDEDIDFSAWYAYTSYFLTGESRPYKNGIFNRIKPRSTVGRGGIGAWEVALRYSQADLTDGTIIGGEEKNFTFGVNWYATQNVRFAANYIKVLELDRPGNQYDDEKLDSFVLRAQIDF